MGDKGGNIEAKELLARNLKRYRTLAELSQRKLALVCELEVSQISRIELAHINTSVSTIFILAKALGIKPAQLLED